MAPKNSAHTFARGIPAKFLFNPQRRQINKKNGLMLSTVKELLEMTQLTYYQIIVPIINLKHHATKEKISIKF